MFKILTFIGIGSFLGGIARYGLSKAVIRVIGLPSFWGTLAANLIGCLLIGIFYGIFDRYNVMNEHWRLFLTVGFCGGFTTFSTFVHENYSSISNGQFLQMTIYATLSFAAGLLMVHIGHLIVKQFY